MPAKAPAPILQTALQGLDESSNGNCYVKQIATLMFIHSYVWHDRILDSQQLKFTLSNTILIHLHVPSKKHGLKTTQLWLPLKIRYLCQICICQADQSRERKDSQTISSITSKQSFKFLRSPYALEGLHHGKPASGAGLNNKNNAHSTCCDKIQMCGQNVKYVCRKKKALAH